MTKDVGILILGLIVATMPFLGFPNVIERSVIVISGLLIAFIAFLIRSEVEEVQVQKNTESFIQNTVQTEEVREGNERHERNEV